MIREERIHGEVADEIETRPREGAGEERRRERGREERRDLSVKEREQ